MCTAITFRTKDSYFGRTLDYDVSFMHRAVITPRGFEFSKRDGLSFKTKYNILGIARIEDGFPLYFDAINQAGLCMAALNFVGNAHFNKPHPNKDNVAQFEFIPWLLGDCKNLREAKEKLNRINLTDTPFSDSLPIAQLHWLIADKDSAITVESLKGGIKIYDNPVGVLTNNPTFDIQMFSLNSFMRLSPAEPQNCFSDKINLCTYSRGMGALGLPGDLSSQSRFVRAAFTKLNSVCEEGENESVGQFFHILETVSQTRGCCETQNRKHEITLYTTCYNASRGILYYTTYNNRQISAISLSRATSHSRRLISFPLIDTQQINFQS